MASSGGGDENEIQIAGTSSYNADDESNWDASSDQDKEVTLNDVPKRRAKTEKEKKLGHRRVGVGGEITYKKIQTSQIMGSIQLGIQQAVGSLASKPERDLLMQDFMTVETTVFSSSGSNHTPAHHYSEFTFKTYAPIAFRYFRDLFGIQPDDFLVSFCSSPLRELSNPGASGSIFYVTQDDEFIMKTVQHKEGEFLQKLLPGYYMNLNQNPHTLLPKFFGLYCYQCNSKNIRLVAMNNLLPSNIEIHLKYDLKGSTYKRKASKVESQKKSPTYKDLDFIEHHPEGIFLEADTYTALVKTIQRDCRVLESFKIMDYSLLVGIHNLDQAAREKKEKPNETANAANTGAADKTEIESPNCNSGSESDDRGAASCSYLTSLNRVRSMNRQRLVAHSTAMESIQAESDPVDEVENSPPGGIPARNNKGERLFLFLGIIDILQSYRLKKKIEHTVKALIHDGDTVSVHKPGFYAQRFQEFMAKKVFKKIPSSLKPSPSRRKSNSRPLPRSHDAELENDRSTASPGLPLTSPLSQQSTPPVSPPIYPSVLKDRPNVVMSVGSPINARAPPPVPPRGVRGIRFQGFTKGGYIRSNDIPSCSTPPPGFDEVTQDHIIERRAPASDSSDSTGKCYPLSSLTSTPIRRKESQPHSHLFNISDSKFDSDERRSTVSVGSNSSASAGTGSLHLPSSHRKPGTWTPAASSMEGGSTPTWTEGTPSFTDSSSSGDIARLGTPIRGVKERLKNHTAANEITTRSHITTSRNRAEILTNEVTQHSASHDDDESQTVTEIVSSF